MKCLGIDQNEEKRFKVMLEEKYMKRGQIKTEIIYLKINSEGKMIGVNLVSRAMEYGEF